jgi:tungstate transport system substrate-binding protein
MWKAKNPFIVLTVTLIVVLSGGNPAAGTDQILKMATTTSTDNTGMLDYLAPLFRADTGIDLRWIAVGTGKALELGKNCDVDVLLVHAPEAEREYVQQGYGVERREIMFNDFVFIGPKQDAAGIRGKSVRAALHLISSGKAPFASRGDNSGTHKMEISLWKHAGLQVPDRTQWYLETGQGMLDTITIAAERDAYTLTDRGTYIKYGANWHGNPPLVILVEGDEMLRNQYSIIAVNPQRCKNVKYELARQLSTWMASPKAQKLIGDFQLMGKRLFIPNAGKE